MPSDEWIKTLADGSRMKFTYQELPDEGAFITAQVEGNKVVYSIVSRVRVRRSSLRTATFDNRRAHA